MTDIMKTIEEARCRIESLRVAMAEAERTIPKPVPPPSAEEAEVELATRFAEKLREAMGDRVAAFRALSRDPEMKLLAVICGSHGGYPPWRSARRSPSRPPPRRAARGPRSTRTTVAGSPTVPTWNQLLTWLKDVDLLRKADAP